TDPEVMRQLGGPIDRDRLARVHSRRIADPWYFKIVAEAGAPAVGTIGVWGAQHGDGSFFETGWMVLAGRQRRGSGRAAPALLVGRATADPRFPSIPASPPVTNAPSNALCRKFGFVLVREIDFVYAGRTLRCNHWSLQLSSR